MLMTAGTFSCSLNEEPYTSIPISSYFSKPEDFTYYLNGAYSLLVTGNTWGGAAIATQLFDDDDTQAGTTYRPGVDGLYDMINRTADAWRGFFSLVQQTSMFIYGLDNYGSILTDQQRDNFRGQALFLRAHAYIELTRRFGPIPLRDGPYLDGISTPNLARTPQIKVYEKVIKDLEEASKLLPIDYSSGEYKGASDRGKPTKQAAFGLMMKAYMELAGSMCYNATIDLDGHSIMPDANKVRESYQGALNAGDSIFYYAALTNFPKLEVNYMTPFNTKTQNTCDEILFAAQTLTNQAGKGVELAFTLCPPGSNLSGSADVGGGEVSLRWDFIGKVFSSDDKRIEWGTALVDSFYNSKSNEKRWYFTYNPYVRPTATEKSGTIPLGYLTSTSESTWFTRYATPDHPYSVNDSRSFGFNTNIDVRWQSTSSTVPSRRATPKIYSKKYTDLEATGKLSNGCDIILVRYADIKLLYAEAANELGKTADAITQIDNIRNRAGISLIKNVYPGIGQSDLRDSIQLERRRELYLEFNRRWDLIRWGKFKTTMDSAKRPRMWWQTLYAIPVQELTANEEITQNNYGW